MSNYNKINIQLGDIIEFNSPSNIDLHNNIFYVKYIDDTQIDIINPDKQTSIDIKDSKIQDESIVNIFLLHRHESSSYAIQNNLIPGKSISIFFTGKLPTIINGKITNLEEDMIEIITHPNKDTIYIDFAYFGIPKSLNIEKIIEIEDIKLSDLQDEDDYEDEDEYSVKNQPIEGDDAFVKQYDVEQNVVVSIKDDNDEFKIYDTQTLDFDTIKIGEDLDEFQHTVNVDESELRYTLEHQIEDYIDKHLNNIPPIEMNNKKLENINREVLRFVELREKYSFFDENNNPNILPPLDDNYKPLINNYLKNLDNHVEWLIPITNNVRELIVDNEEKCEIYNDDKYLQLIKYNDFIESISNTINEWYSKSAKPCEYKHYINRLLSLFSNSINSKLDVDETMIKFVNNVTNTIVNNYNDFTGYSIGQPDEIKKTNYTCERLNVGLMGQEIDETNKKLKNDIKLTNNDSTVITGILTLNQTYYNYSIKRGLYSSVLDCANISKCSTIFDTIYKDEVFDNIYKYTNFENSQKILPNEIVQDIELLKNINTFYYDKSVSDINSTDNYIDLLNFTIPDNNTVIDNLSKYYIYYNNRTFIKCHQGYGIDFYNINYNTYSRVQKYIKNNIENYDNIYKTNLNDIELLINKLQAEIIDEYKIETSKSSYSKLNFIDKELHNDIYTNYNINPDIGLTTQEIIKYIYDIDNGSYLNSVLNKNILNLLITNLLDTYIKNKEQQDKEQPDKEQQDKEQPDKEQQDKEQPDNEQQDKDKANDETDINSDCIKYIISKKYTNQDLLFQDNDKLIFFDEEFDHTNYSLVNNYLNERQLMDDYKFVEFLQMELIGNLGIEKSIALREAKAIVDKKREVLDGDYAILQVPANTRNYIYIRKENKWVIDEKFLDNFFIDGNQLFCNINRDCVYNDKKCDSIDKRDDSGVRNILRNFTLEYNVSIEEIKQKINREYEIATQRIKQIIDRNNRSNTNKNTITLDVDLYKDDTEYIVSPYEYLKNLILGENNIVNKYDNIKQFCILFTREANVLNDESIYWLYCKKINVKLIPIFLLKLANVFIERGNYTLELDNICASQGTISSDNNYWIDKYSGYIIKPIEYSNEEGYDDTGYKLKTKDIIEAEYSINNPKQQTYLTRENQYVVNIVNAVSNYMGINIESNIEFIINGVSNLQKTLIMSEKTYNDMLLKAKEKDPKSKALPSYNDMYNSSLIIITLSYLLIVIQTNIPPISSKKTFPGCIKSFCGYPIDGEQDKSGLIYIMCVANKIKSSVEPWNSILKMSESTLCKKAETIIEKYIIKIKEVRDLIEKKLEYKQLHVSQDITKDISIEKWHNFKPPLQEFKIDSVSLQSIPKHYHEKMIDDIKTGKENQYREQLISKMLYFTNGIISSIQTSIKGSTLLLSNNNNEPFLENSCCHGTNIAIDYFIEKDKLVQSYINNISSLQSIIKNINNLNTATILYDPTNTILKIPNIESGYNENIIYGAFINYCNFGLDIPISSDLESLCLGKPSGFDKSKSLTDNIEYLKANGKNYTHEMLLELLQYIGNKNTKKNIITNIAVNNTVNIKTIIENEIYKNSNSDYELLFNEKFYILFNNLLDNYSIKKSISEDVRLFKNYLGSQNNILNKTIIEYIKINSNKSKREIDKMIEMLNTKFKVHDNLFIKNSIYKLIHIYPTYLINNTRKLGKIPKHWNLSPRHNDDIYNIIETYYSLFNSFNNKDYLSIIFKTLSNKTGIIVNLFQYIKYIKPIYLDRDKKQEIESIYDEDFILMISQYFLYSILFEIINIKNSDIFMFEILNSDDYDNDEYDKVICEIIEIYISSLFKHYNSVNIDYNKINEKINIAKEHEKTNITDFLKSLSDEEREIQNIFKNNKLEKWSVGLQKGMTQYVKHTYDEELNVLEKQAQIDKKLNNQNQVTDMNKDIYQLDLEEEDKINEEIEKEEYNMNNIPDDDDYNSDMNDGTDIESDYDNDSDVEFD